MDIKDYIVKEDATILEVLNVINNNGRGIAYVCDGTRLLAAVTDGNIRRHILSNGNLNDTVDKIANYEPKYISRKDEINPVDYMNEKHVSSIPVLNSKHEIITIKFLSKDNDVHTVSNLDIPVVIMAGGKGTRLKPLTTVLPKPLIPIGDKTITEIIMDKFIEFGCNKFKMIVNYKKELIQTFFDEYKDVYDVSFIEEKEFLGTGGGLYLLKGMYDGPFFLTNCDIVIDDDYGEIVKQHKEDNRIITMICALKQINIPYGTVELDDQGHVGNLHEKPNAAYMVNTGCYLIDSRFLDYIPDNTFIHITDIISKCIENGEKVGVYPISENNWWDMGNFKELNTMIKWRAE